jgi:hypothetical protein
MATHIYYLKTKIAEKNREHLLLHTWRLEAGASYSISVQNRWFIVYALDQTRHEHVRNKNENSRKGET